MKFILTLVTLFVTLISVPNKTAKSNDTKSVYASSDSNASSMVSNASLSNTQVNQLFNSLDSGSINDVFISDYYESVYFANLSENIGNNRFGSCSYVALGMLLSFYDSYWSDLFIPETYDVEPTSVFTTYSSADFAFPSFSAESPGISFEPTNDINSLSPDDYLIYAATNSDLYFQCKLISLSQTYFGSAKFEDESNPFGMTFSDISGFLTYYLYQYRNFTTSQVLIDSCNDTSLVRSYTINKIKAGVPVILRSESSSLGGHAFIAYDYDEDSDEIYVHTGWRDENSGKTLSHVSLSSTGFTNLSDALSLNVLMPSTFSYNYHSTTGGNGCARNFIFPQDIVILSGNYRDELPTFAWKSIYKEKWIENSNPYFDFSVLNQSSQQIFKVEEIDSKEITLTQNQWNSVLDTSSNTYYAYAELGSLTYSYWDDYYAKKAFAKPLEYNQLPQIKPSEYGFADAYPSDNTTKTTFISHTASHNFTFETRRYRTGYIHNEYIVMSPIRNGFQEAYIEYRFSYAVTRIDVELAHWRETSHEWLTSSTGEASVQYYWENQWVDKLDLLSSSTALPTNRNSHTFYKIEFDNPVYRVRFHAETFSANTNDNNRGRICIGNMAFYKTEYNLPLSGGELDYEPSSWNACRSYTNCYAYALDVKTNPYPTMWNRPWALQPGTSDSFSHLSESNYLTKSFLELMVGYDGVNYNFSFESISKSTKCSEGCYKVALVIAPNQDYHWYRQNSDGTWSHKPGNGYAIKTDYQSQVIYDPQYCDRRYNYGGTVINYSVFCGFYQVNISNINVDIYGG